MQRKKDKEKIQFLHEELTNRQLKEYYGTSGTASLVCHQICIILPFSVSLSSQARFLNNVSIIYDQTKAVIQPVSLKNDSP